jgi:hypothetical protein
VECERWAIDDLRLMTDNLRACQAAHQEQPTLFVRHEPMASMTALDVKFSDAMSSSPLLCLSFSCQRHEQRVRGGATCVCEQVSVHMMRWL